MILSKNSAGGGSARISGGDPHPTTYRRPWHYNSLTCVIFIPPLQGWGQSVHLSGAHSLFS